ncbi:MAG: AAA family ATPase [Desulfobacterales bacterium]|nr:AAA family ATPase [Desulfobacterales bacterium]
MNDEWEFPGCPRPPDWRLEWERILRVHPLLPPLARCPQDPVFHQEGDVLTHTRMVCRALTADERWRTLPAADRSVLFAAALLHDAAKPRKTAEGANGRIHSRGHAAAGARVARGLLYRWEGLSGPAPTFEQRERVVDLIRYHGLPLQWMERENAQRDVIKAASRAPGEWLAMLSRADVLGRISDDRDDLLERVRLFREFCLEEGCGDGSRDFPSGTTRFLYLRGERASPDVAVYDPSDFEATVMSGLPGAGKDTWIAAHGQGLPVISLDDIRGRLGVPPSKNQGAVVHKAREDARVFLRKAEPFIWNATNITFSIRRSLIQLFLDYRARARIIYVETPYQELLARNARRRESLPRPILEKLIHRLEPPALSEAHDVRWEVSGW